MSIEIVVTATPEVVEDNAAPAVLETIGDSQVLDVTSIGSDIVTETEAEATVIIAEAEVITETETETSVVVAVYGDTLTERWVEATIIEAAMQGPAGPPGSTAGNYPAKHLTYADGQLVEVMMFHDAAATQVAEQRTLAYTDGTLTSIEYRDVLGVLLNTRSFMYTAGVLTGISDS